MPDVLVIRETGQQIIQRVDDAVTRIWFPEWKPEYGYVWSEISENYIPAFGQVIYAWDGHERDVRGRRVFR